VLRPSSSVGSSGDDIRLEVRLVNIGRGGTRPAVSKEFLASLSGDPAIEEPVIGDCWCRLSWAVDLPSACFPGEGPEPIGEGDLSLRAPTPKKPPLALDSFDCLEPKGSAFVLGIAGTGMDSSGVGGIWLKRGCIDLGRFSRSTLVFKPRPTLRGTAWSSSEPES
jgi:hypothetical protein